VDIPKKVYPQLKKTIFIIKVATYTVIENITIKLSEYSKKHLYNHIYLCYYTYKKKLILLANP